MIFIHFSVRSLSRFLQWQMNDSLADIILEMGYSFTASIEECRNALLQLGVEEFKPAILARMLSAMIKTHSGLKDHTQIYVNQATLLRILPTKFLFFRIPMVLIFQPTTKRIPFKHGIWRYLSLLLMIW